MEQGGYVYILASKGNRLYIGVTSELMIRVKKHKNRACPDSHTARYNIDQLAYYEVFGRIEEAITREKELKGWTRIKKIQLIVFLNPTWRDLSEDWGKPSPPFDESKMRPPTTFQFSRSKQQQTQQQRQKPIQRFFASLRMTLRVRSCGNRNSNSNGNSNSKTTQVSNCSRASTPSSTLRPA